jgi:hypothetical protein
LIIYITDSFGYRLTYAHDLDHMTSEYGKDFTFSYQSYGKEEVDNPTLGNKLVVPS